MNNLSDDLLFHGLSVDIGFRERQPNFGDLLSICGIASASFAPTGVFGSTALVELQFTQVDDCFGVPTLGNVGGNVAIWLFPIVNGEEPYHHPGPFDAIRLSYCVLRNPSPHAAHFTRCVQEFAMVGAGALYRERHILLGFPPDLSPLHSDIEAVAAYWAERGVEVGSDPALAIDF